MAKRKEKIKPATPSKRMKLALSKRQQVILGSFLMFFGIALILSFVSYFFTWEPDQSQLGNLSERKTETSNLLSKFGAFMGHLFIYDGFGVAAFILAFLILISGWYLFMNKTKAPLVTFWFWGLLLMVWFSVFFGFFHTELALLGGVIGFEMNDYLQDYIGATGTALLLAFVMIFYLVMRLKITPDTIVGAFKSSKATLKDELETSKEIEQERNVEVRADRNPKEETETPTVKTFKPEEVSWSKSTAQGTPDAVKQEGSESIPLTPERDQSASTPQVEVQMEVEEAPEEEEIASISEKLVKDFGQFDPRLELSNYRFPPLDLLKDHTSGSGITIDQEELEENKNKIVETLNNYKIGISNIKATVGPTVTLYEIIPDAGIRISKIKNLEDDIALSLSALGIRIIAPIPGRGTIGIEVPNKNPKTVSMRSVIASQRFQNAEMELPIAFGKTISNETFVADLAKMPHLLMAGATGQGKSVGLNAILTSLLYKKHPAEVKFILVDPKKVELTLFNKIERHYLAKLPDSDEAIITDTTKVINTLNSLCIEMDARYDLLKDAMVRNIKEYNQKFKNRKLNPNEGHRFLPYIVLVIDEFADLIMTAGKEVETPIARLAQLARAIGIHLIIATQRPSVNVITGIIKANFPARVAFRVTSKIDSRTILDNSGADQLIGRGDMLYTQGNELTRLQCAFVDTPEVADIVDFIGAQKAYPEALLLPEYVGEEAGTTLDIDIDDRDPKFREAAETIVIAQSGSTSLLQRKLKLGYNRAGRIIDQLEAAGIVGPFEGSKAREVLVPTIDALNQLLNEEQNE